MSSKLDAKVYFSSFSNKPWQNCYTGQLTVAKEQILKRQFPDSPYWENVDVKVSGNKLLVRYLSYNKEYDVVFQKCSFKDGDELVKLNCNVTVQTPRHSINDMPWSELIQLHNAWTNQSSHLGIISCQNKIIKTVTNSWNQIFTLQDYLIADEIIKKGQRVIIIASGVVEETKGLSSHQNWQAKLGFYFLKSRFFPELCDASVDQLSLESATGKKLQETWCPWGIEIVQLNCAGKKPLKSKAPKHYPLDVNNIEIKNFCSLNN